MKQNLARVLKDYQPVILSSSLTSVAVRPSLQCALTDDNTRRNIRAGMNWTSSISTTPVSRNWFESAKQGVTIEQHKTPLLFAHPLHHTLRLPRALRAVRDHRVRTDANRAACGTSTNQIWILRMKVSGRHLHDYDKAHFAKKNQSNKH